MTPFLANLLTGLCCLLGGGLLLWNAPVVGATARALPRSRRAAYLFFGTGAVWFLGLLTRLGEGDLILPRPALVVIFLVLAALSFSQAAEFLAVRGLSILTLLAGWVLLYSEYMIYTWNSYPLKIGVVLAVVAALFMAGYPYRMRDGLAWLFARPRRPRVAGAFLAGYGLLLTALAFTF